jgi:hypothetical protein
MTRVGVTVELRAAAALAEEVWYDPRRWPAFIEGFARIVRLTEDWPAVGAELEWESTPAGRGRVRERVIAYQPGSGQSVAVSDSRMSGTQSVAFEPLGDGVAVTFELDYKLRGPALMNLPLDLLFVRRAVRDSLRRTLQRFGHELDARHGQGAA